MSASPRDFRVNPALLGHARQRGSARPGLLASIGLVGLLLMPILGTALWSSERQAVAERDRYGSTVVARLAAAAREPVLANDRIALAVLVREFTELDGLATVAVYGADDRLMAAADGVVMSPAEFEGGVGARVFVEQITLQDSIAGYARIALDPGAFSPDHLPLVTLALVLSTLGVALSRLQLAVLWERLTAWREASEAERQDLRESLRARQDGLLRLPVIEGDDELPRSDETAPSSSLYLVVVNLFNQVSLSASERSEVIDACEELLDRVCRLYGGHYERLPGTGIGLVLDALADEGDHAFQAVCVALLAARVFEGLNADRRRDGEVPLALRIGVERVVDDQADTHLGVRPLADACPDSVARAVTLSALARERTIVVGDGVRSRCAQPSRLIAETLDSPVLRAAGADTAWLVRDLAEGYRGLLDRQAQLLLGAT